MGHQEARQPGEAERDLGQQLPYWLLVGMLPLLASYGGRYFMHSIPLWSLFAAQCLHRLTPPVPRARRCVGLMLLTLALTLLLILFSPTAPKASRSASRK